MAATALVLKDADLRLAALLICLFGAVVCSSGPYVSVLAVDRFGLGDAGFAALMVASTALSVGAALWSGIRADQTAGRKRLALAALALLTLGQALMVLHPSPISFVLAHAVLLPAASPFFGQIFALARLAAQTHPPDQQDGIMAVIRALFAAPFVVVLPLWSLVFRQGVDLLAVYPAGLALSIFMLGITARLWPRDGKTPWQDRPSGLSFGAALREMAHPTLLFRLLALGAVTAANAAQLALLSLILVPEAGRGPQDVALFAGIVAGLEVPFMLALPLIARGRNRSALILVGGALYGAQLALLPVLAPTALLWLLLVPAAMGASVILTLPIAYVQDLLSDRPGAGSSLIALQKLVADTLAALAFALGTALAGYGLVALISAALALIGGTTLVLADRRPR